MKVVNLFAGPGVGKTATAKVLSGLLSQLNYRSELVPEFAKFATYSNNRAALSDQIYMFAKQENRLHVLRDTGMDFVVMDGPLPLALLFTPDEYYKSYEPLVMEVFNSYENINILLEPNPTFAYQQHGRNENQAEAQALQERVVSLLERHRVPYISRMVTKELPWELLNHLTGRTVPA